MVENKNLREEEDKAGSNPGEVFDYEYFRTKYNLTMQEVMEAIKEAKTSSPLVLDEYIANKYKMSEDNPDAGTRSE
jgi:hypothetical protein